MAAVVQILRERNAFFKFFEFLFQTPNLVLQFLAFLIRFEF